MPTLFSLEALQAEAGDSLLLHIGDGDDRHVVLIDGGPDGVYEATLRPRLEELGAGKPLPLPLVVVSHIDDDHIVGIIALLAEIDELAGRPGPAKVRNLWHNAFDAAQPRELIEQTSTAELGEQAAAVVASYPNGQELDRLRRKLKLKRNPPFDGLVVARAGPAQSVDIAGCTLTVVAPREDRLRALEDEWREKLKAGAPAVEVAARADRSITNRSSIVLLAECAGKTMLLTGDARGKDDLLDAVDAAGLAFTRDAPLDVLKVPHHGSDANMTKAAFERLPARHYVFSANGLHSNPDVATLRMLAAARDDDDFTLHFTNRAMTDPKGPRDVGGAVAAWLAAQKDAGRGFGVVFRDDAAPSVVVDLLDDEVFPAS